MQNGKSNNIALKTVKIIRLQKKMHKFQGKNYIFMYLTSQHYGTYSWTAQQV
jgi:predicted NAD-dependent protein-ADP-ribosyltransferase YbiA (DUF1768 family)